MNSFHVGIAPYHANFSPDSRKYYGPANASYQLLNDSGKAVATLDYDCDKVDRFLCSESVSEHARDSFITQAQYHFSSSARWNA